MQPDDIYLASFPFGDAAGMKLRPVLLLTNRLGSVPEVVVAYISSVIPAALLPSDIVLDPGDADAVSTNLKTKSVLRLHKLATIHASAVVRRLGAISARTRDEVDIKLRALLDL
ncbi:MAG TPA: type II toxin-antitoxin system PemK/MazF family toxin [Pirellulales bacterium]|jgi:mRNA-degrading endonuclease toxin of MazEF toxin-antitoxin module|nr:type II toxin-antitoxin system PemK/MazF family toxin [Pirellulales bacterium]